MVSIYFLGKETGKERGKNWMLSTGWSDCLKIN